MDVYSEGYGDNCYPDSQHGGPVIGITNLSEASMSDLFDTCNRLDIFHLAVPLIESEKKLNSSTASTNEEFLDFSSVRIHEIGILI